MLPRTPSFLHNARLISRSDSSLVAALLVAAVILFQQPLHALLDVAHQVETRYQVDLLPALAVLLTVFLFHGYKKRQQVHAEARAAAAEAAQMRARLEELERLMTFSQSLANSLDRKALQQVLWRYLPTFAHERETWIVLARPDGAWDPLLLDARFPDRPLELLEALANNALVDTANPACDGTSARGDQVCFAMRVGGQPIGVMGISSVPPLAHAERQALGTAAALIGIALRNMQLLQDTREHALRDSLTGCINHAHGLKTLGAELRRAARARRPLSILMFDLDRFKQINDQLGHLQGDAVLAAVGARLTEILRTSDICCRYGGDEFLVILPDTPVLGAEQVAASVRREIDSLRIVAGARAPIAITASFGVAGAGAGETDAITLIARADEALYRAKQDGRDRFCVEPPPQAHAGAAPSVVARQANFARL